MKVTVPLGVIGATELALSVAVNVTELPTATEFPGEAEMVRVPGRAVVVYGADPAAPTT